MQLNFTKTRGSKGNLNKWGQELEFKEYRDLVFRPIIKLK